jgi:hypothetical protein
MIGLLFILLFFVFTGEACVFCADVLPGMALFLLSVYFLLFLCDIYQWNRHITIIMLEFWS